MPALYVVFVALQFNVQTLREGKMKEEKEDQEGIDSDKLWLFLISVLLLQFLADPHLSISHVNYSLDQVCLGMLKCFGVLPFLNNPNLWRYIKNFLT